MQEGIKKVKRKGRKNEKRKKKRFGEGDYEEKKNSILERLKK